MNDFTETNQNTHVVDVDNIDEAKFEVIPNGWYKARVIEHDYALSQSSGQPMWTLKIQIEGGEYDGRSLYNHMSWSPKAAPYTKASTQKCFPDVLTDPQYRTADNRLDIKKIGDESAFAGREVDIKVGSQMYEGDKRNNIRDMRPSAETNEFLQA
jgi:hypothetical protein